jgi:hypothetical protein
MNGFILRIWYKKLDQIFGSKMNDMWGVAAKCLVDQLVLSPLAILLFFGVKALRGLGDVSLAEVGRRLEAKVRIRGDVMCTAAILLSQLVCLLDQQTRL